MSLAQHVSSTEGIDRQELFIEPSHVVRKVLSYDAFPPSNVADQAEHTAAYKVSARTRALQVVITVLICWLASGIVFGYAAIKPVLVSEGVYRERCTQDELESGVEVCVEQDIRYLTLHLLPPPSWPRFELI